LFFAFGAIWYPFCNAEVPLNALVKKCMDRKVEALSLSRREKVRGRWMIVGLIGYQFKKYIHLG
jgi:hypothetical protein